MNCTEFDLKAYVLAELTDAELRQIDAHLKSCPACREELERLRLTQAALLTLPEEEIPRRIGFVSDKVFEPNWWQRFWQSGPRLAFASAAMLSVAILVQTFARPAPAPPAVDTGAIEARVSAEVARRMQPAIEQAVAQAEARQASKAAAQIEAAEKRMEFRRAADQLQVKENFDYLKKHMGRMYLASSEFGGRQ